MRAVLCLLALTVLALFIGCGGSKVAVSGQVKVDGQPLRKGQIEFWPAAGGGTPIAGPIVDGKYKTAPMEPGEKKVVITEDVAIEVVTSNEEMQRLAAEGKTPPPPPMSRITEQTKGNSRQVTIGKEHEQLDFELELK